MSDRIVMRDATKSDLDIVAGIFSRARRTLTFVPELHSEAEDRDFVRDVMFKTCHVRLAFYDKRACGFVAIKDNWIHQMHVDPGHVGKGVGSALIRDAKCLTERIELWCFRDNKRARQLYERHGFKPVEETDGAGNEEKMPDVRYVWMRNGLG